MEKKKILLVSSSPCILHVIGISLDELYKVIPANSGQEAIDKITYNEVDLVVADIYMPSMSGYTLAENINRLCMDKQIREIPIVAVATDISDTTDILESPEQEGQLFKRFITTPANGVEVRGVVADVLGEI
jgi:CheY-like chemotaxis protein